MEKLTDVCDFQGGSQPPKEEWSFEEQDGYIRMLQIRDFTQSERVIPEYIKISNSTKICNADDVLIARYGASIGKILTGLSGAYNVAIMRTIPDESKLRKRYLYYYFKSPYFQNSILNVGSRAAQAGFNKEDLSKLNINCPVFSEQDSIIQRLEKIERVLQLRKQELDNLDELIKARFVEMFGEIKNTVRLGDCCDIHARIGWQALTKDEHMQTGEYMLVTGTDFIDGRVNYDTCVYVAKERYEMDPHIILKENDVLITKDGSIGKVAVVHDLPKPATLNGGVFVVRPDGRFNKEYISYVFRGPLFERFVELSKTGATIKHLNQKHLVEFEIPLPSAEEQELFAEFSKQVDKSKVVFHLSHKLQRRLRTWLTSSF